MSDWRCHVSYLCFTIFRIVSLSCNPAGAIFACSASAKLTQSGVEGAVSPRPGHLGLYDVKTMKMHVRFLL